MRKKFCTGMMLTLLVSLVPISWAQSTPLNVVASTSIIADVAQNVGGDLVQVSALVPPDTDVHAFQPTPQDAALLADADVILINGAGLESSLGGFIENTTDTELMVVSNGIAVLTTEDTAPTEDSSMGGMEMGGMGMGGDMGVPSAAYVTITNTGSTADTLLAIETDAVTTTSLHETVVVNDVASMSPLPSGIEIPAGGTVELRPGGLHAMLEGVKHDLIVGDTVDLTLKFASGKAIVVPATVDDIPPETGTDVVEGDLTIHAAWVRPAVGMGEAAHRNILGEDTDCGEMAAMHEGEDDLHGGCDPHVWTDPTNVMIWTDNIAAAFAQADPTNAATYTANAEAYKAQLTALDEEVTQILSAIPTEKRVLVTNHDFLAYFAAHYDFDIVGTVLPGFDTLSEPDPQSLAALVETINTTSVNAIFIEVSDAGALANTVAQEVGRDIQVVTLYSDSLGEPGSAAGTYLDYLRYNANAIAAAILKA